MTDEIQIREDIATILKGAGLLRRYGLRDEEQKELKRLRLSLIEAFVRRRDGTSAIFRLKNFYQAHASTLSDDRSRLKPNDAVTGDRSKIDSSLEKLRQEKRHKRAAAIFEHAKLEILSGFYEDALETLQSLQKDMTIFVAAVTLSKKCHERLELFYADHSDAQEQFNLSATQAVQRDYNCLIASRNALDARPQMAEATAS